MTDLRSAALPQVALDDHVRGGHDGAPVLIEYADFECPHCAVLHARRAAVPGGAAQAPVTWVFRHFPSRSRHPRSWPAACAAEAAGLQGKFWEMHDLLFADQGRLDDPHLWERARTLELDVERFDSDRRSDPVLARVKRDFDGGIRAGVAGTPTLFHDGNPYTGDAIDQLLAGLQA